MKRAGLLVLLIVGGLLAGCGGESDHDRETAAIRDVLNESEGLAAKQKNEHDPGEPAGEDSLCVSSNPDNIVSETERRLEDFKSFVVEEVAEDMNLDALQWCAESVELGLTLEEGP